MNEDFFAGLLTGVILDMRSLLIALFLLGLAGLFTGVWLMPRHLVAATAALATALCALLRSLLP